MRLRTTAVLLAAAAALAAPLLPATAQAAAPTTAGADLTLGRNAVGVRPGAATVTGTYIRIHSLYSAVTGQCLDADANNGANGTRVQVWGCNGTTQQEWISWSDYSIESVRFPGMCLDADTNGGGNNGTRLQLWQCNGTTQQQWFMRANDLAIYNQRFNNNLNTVVDRDINLAGNGAQAQLWAKNFQSQQWWQITGA
ncbi:RICIN domain-containing protein [Kitasatospora sp. NPDC059646]|uniref:RICIN domain-containing protein n=1 Tax=Kitasatospora sp. NPDC059646 TaxID=3346893 RepID=UPI003684608D